MIPVLYAFLALVEIYVVASAVIIYIAYKIFRLLRVFLAAGKEMRSHGYAGDE